MSSSCSSYLQGPLSEHYRQLEDCGPLYHMSVNGVVHGPRTNHNGRVTSAAQQLSVHSIRDHCSLTTACGRLIPASLYDICVAFVAANIHLVENLQGFPCLIGQEIFGKSWEMSELDVCSGSVKRVVDMFIRAYSEEDIMTSLNLRGCRMTDSSQMEKVLKFIPCIRSLDVSNANIDDEHWTLPFLGQMERLVDLRLAQNRLTDHGIQVLTARSRMFAKGLSQNLQRVDFRGNVGVTVNSLRYFSGMKRIQCIAMTSDQKSISLVKNYTAENMSLQDSHCFAQIGNNGWASEIVTDWIPRSTKQTPARNANAETGVDVLFTRSESQSPTDVTCSKPMLLPTTHSNNKKIHELRNPNRPTAQPKQKGSAAHGKSSSLLMAMNSSSWQ